MATLFQKLAPAKPPGPYDRGWIDSEIAHLKNRGTVRHADGRGRGFRAVWPAVLTVLAILGLFFMDPVLHAFKRAEAIRVYLYLHHFGSDAKAAQLVDTGIFNPRDVELLNARPGAFNNYYTSPVAADKSANAIIAYLKGVTFLHAGAYDRLDYLGKFRFQLFVRWGLRPPTDWSFLDQKVRE